LLLQKIIIENDNKNFTQHYNDVTTINLVLSKYRTKVSTTIEISLEEPVEKYPLFSFWFF